MPARSRIDPVEMPRRLLPGICIVDVLIDERRYAYWSVLAMWTFAAIILLAKPVLEGFFGRSAEDALSCYDGVIEMKATFSI